MMLERLTHDRNMDAQQDAAPEPNGGDDATQTEESGYIEDAEETEDGKAVIDGAGPDDSSGKNLGGRPVEWTPERKVLAVDSICTKIAEGYSLKSLLAQADSLPSYSSFMTWIGENKEWLIVMEIRGTAAKDEVDALNQAETITHSLEVRIPSQTELFASKQKYLNGSPCSRSSIGIVLQECYSKRSRVRSPLYGGTPRIVPVFETALLNRASEKAGLNIACRPTFGESLGRSEILNARLLGRKNDVSGHR
jgi:hypothetical protein